MQKLRGIFVLFVLLSGTFSTNFIFADDVTNSDGNPSDQVTRTINVVTNDDVLPFSSGTVISSSSSTSTVLSFSSATVVSTSSTTTTSGTPVTFDFYEANDGIVPLTSPSVSSSSSLCNPVFVSGDSNNNGVLDPSEQWHFTCDVVSNTPSIFDIILTGFGIDPDGNIITWPGDPEERIIATIEIINPDLSSTDHYLGYKVKETKHTDKFKKFTVTLSDQFEDAALYKVEKPERLYNLVEKNTEGISDEITHLVGYKIKAPKGEPKFEKVTNVLVTNQFGNIIVDVKKPELLLVPSAMDHLTIPDDIAPAINHYKCYDVKETKGTPKFEKREVTISDPTFGESKTFEVKKPKQLCTPVDKNGEGIIDEENHLLCYDLKKIKGESKFKKRNVFTNNQFEPEDLEVKKEHQLCVPSIKTLP